MPSHGVGDAFYGGILSITYSVSRHPLLSWKASEQPLVGIVINVPPILQCIDSNIKYLLNFTNSITISLPLPLKLWKPKYLQDFWSVEVKLFTSTLLPPF